MKVMTNSFVKKRVLENSLPNIRIQYIIFEHDQRPPQTCGSGKFGYVRYAQTFCLPAK